MFGNKSISNIPGLGPLCNSLKKSSDEFGIIRFIFSLPVITIYCVSYALLSPFNKTSYQIQYEELNKKIIAQKKVLSPPQALSPDLFYYSGIWQKMPGENPLADKLAATGLEYLYKSLNFLKDIQDRDETALKAMIRGKISGTGHEEIDENTVEKMYRSITGKGEYYNRLFDQLFTIHGLKKLGSKYSDTDVDIFFNRICNAAENRQFRRLLGAFILNAPYYLVIKNSVNEYYQNSSVLIPVDLFCFTLFMMFLEEGKNRKVKPSIDECRNWVFSVIAPDEEKRAFLLSRPFSFQHITREEMIMPNPGYKSKGYHKKKHKAIDIASGRGTMIRSPLTGTVRYYERSSKKSRTGNFIIIKDEKSEYSIFICHMDDKDYMEDHSTEGELAEPIANLEPDWIHPLKKGQFFQFVGNTGKSTGAHTHIQIARTSRPHETFDFLSVNEPYRKQFDSYLTKDRLWQAYSRNEDLFLSVLGMLLPEYDSTRHFSDRDRTVLEQYAALQKNYTPVSAAISPLDIAFEKISESVLRTCFSKEAREKILNEQYKPHLNYYAKMFYHLRFMTGQQIPLPAPSPDRGTPLTHWYIIRKRRDYDGSTDEEDMHSRIFYQAVNLFFLYKLMQINETPKEIRSSLLSDPLYTGNTRLELPENILFFPEESDEDRIARFAEQINRITGIRPDLSVIGEDDFCESLFSIIREESASAGIPLDQVFGFFRYHMKDMQQSYQTSRFITFPETRELLYDTKFDSILKSFFFGLFELAADHNYTEIFYLLFSETGNSRIPVTKKVGLKIRKIQTKASAAINHFIFRKPYPAVQAAVPKGLFSVVRNLTGNIVRPVSYKSARYAEGFSYRSAEKSIFHTLIYNLYLSGREHYMKLFPEDQLTAVIDAIGLFDGMFKVYCDNAAQKQLIDNERGRIELELEAAGKERDLARLSKKQLQQEFIKETAKLKQLGDYISEHARLFSNYFSEEEEINKRIIYLEQSIDKYRNECITLKNLNTIMQNQHSEKVESMSSEIESLKSTWALDQDRFMIEIKNISFQKEKADREISRLKKEINELKNSRILMKKYEKAILDRNIKDSALEKELENLRKEIKSLKIRNTAFINTFCSITGTAAEDISPDELSGILAPIKKDADAYRDQNSFIGLLKDQQKNDRRSLMLNAKLIDDLKEKIERFESQLQNYQDTSSSSQEKDLKEKNRQLGITAIKLQEEVKALRAIINKQK